MRRFQLKCAIKLFIFMTFICSFVLVYLFSELLENEKFKFLLAYRKRESVEQFVSSLVSQMTFVNSAKVDWNATKSWLNSRQIHPNDAQHFGDILLRMSSERIVRASVGGVGTQIKMMLTLAGGQKVLFKPMVEKREYIADSSPYAGKDRHNCEIASFHLNRILNFRRCPLVIGRRLNLTEMYKIADLQLKKTFFKKANNLCFYGVCHYCAPSRAICADANGVLEGAIILWIPHSLTKFKHPWSRTYKKNVLAKWEKNSDYCAEVKTLQPYRTGPRLLDLIDAAIFDFISGNADRHHYEVLNGFNDGVVLLLDNGKSFGNPFKDEISILAPFVQCCLFIRDLTSRRRDLWQLLALSQSNLTNNSFITVRIRHSTWQTLIQFTTPQNSLSISMQLILSKDPVAPVLTEPNLRAMDRRLRTIILEIEKCISKHGKQIVINDNF